MSEIQILEIESAKEMESILLAFKDSHFLEPATRDEYRNTFIQKHLENGHFIAEFHGEEPVGFISFYANNKITKTSFVTALVIKESLGFMKGKTLMRLLKKSIQIVGQYDIEKVRLEVEKDNAIAIRLYKHLGFEFIPEKTPNECSVFMEADFSKFVAHT